MENPFTPSEEEYEADNREENVNISYSDIAVKLLKDKLWLTALELHTELIEGGKEVPKLKEFFSNPVNFENQSRLDILPSIPRSSSQVTLDSLDLTRFSEDGERVADERAVLEFELRKAKETINSLRANLTCATVEGTNLTKTGVCDAIKPHEQRALNFLINEYLLTRGYKLTSITFSDENEDQDFEDWDDVGLNMPKPSELLHLYRVGMREREKFESDASIQTDPIEPVPVIEQVEPIRPETCEIGVQAIDEFPPNDIAAKKSDISGSFEEINDTDLEAGKLSLLNESIDMEMEEVEEDISFNKKEDITSLISSEGSPKPPSESPIQTIKQSPENFTGFIKEVWSHLPPLRTLENFTQASNEGLVLTLGQTLNTILKQLPNNKEWLAKIVPILVSTICLHPDEKTKDSLIHCLLNVKKRPTQEDRNIILAGIISICEAEDESINSLVLSACWETIPHKYPEKRVLVAQACAHMSPLISSVLRNSLLISMLFDLFEDHDEGVRAQTITSLAIIICQMNSEKYSEVEEVTLKGLLDRSDAVVQVTKMILLPVTARWALQKSTLHTHLVNNILSHLEKLIQKQEKETKACNLLSGLVQILPFVLFYTATADTVIHSISPSIPPPQYRTGFANVCKGLSNPVLFYQDHPVGAVIGAFDYCLQQLSPWPELSWIIDVLIPKMLKILDKVNPEKEELILSFVNFFSNLTAGFGTVFTTQYVKSIFLDRLATLEKALIDMENEWPPLTFIPVFCLGILAPLQSCEEELGKILGRLIINLGLCNAPLQCLHLSIRHLAEGGKLSNTLMSALWQGVVHQRAGVKKATCELLIDMVEHCSEQTISSRIIPALVTLGSDPDMEIRISTLPVYALIIEHTKNKEALDKIYLQVQSVVNDPLARDKAETMIHIISSLGKMGLRAEQTFREDVIFVELNNITKAGFDLAESNRSDVAAALVDAFSNMIFFEISKNCLNTVLLPTLRLLETFCKEVLPSHVNTATAMIKEIEARVGSSLPSSTSRSSMSLGAISPTNVEDMKQRVTKIFNSPMAKSQNIQNVMFWKK